MRIDIDTSDLEKMLAEIEKAASETEIFKTNQKIIEKAEPEVKMIMSRKIPKSKDISQSGRGFGRKSSVSQHAADSIPISRVRKRGTGAEADVGWSKADNSEHFYVKFINWGTIYRPPQEFIFETAREADKEIERIAEREYKALLKRTVGE